MAQTSDKTATMHAHTYYDFDPDGTDAVDVAWVDMRDFENFYAAFVRTIGTSNVDTFKILANAESDGSGTDVTVVTHAVANEPNAVGDYIFLECTAEQIAQEASDAGVDNVRYVSAQLEFATGTDEGVVHYHRWNPKRANDALTSENIA